MEKIITKKLKIQPNKNFNDFKIQILQSLKIYDHKNNCLLDYEERIVSYFKRNKNLKIEIEIDKQKLFKTIYDFNWGELKEYKKEIPQNYPWGASNMETQCYYEPIVCDEKYYDAVEKTITNTQTELEELLDNLIKLKYIEIIIKE